MISIARWPGYLAEEPYWWSLLEQVTERVRTIQYNDRVPLPELAGIVVLVSPKDAAHMPGTESLADFEHPEDCTYVFGPDHSDLNIDRRFDHRLYIPGAAHLSACDAARIVLYDREAKRGRS